MFYAWNEFLTQTKHDVWSGSEQKQSDWNWMGFLLQFRYDHQENKHTTII